MISPTLVSRDAANDEGIMDQISSKLENEIKELGHKIKDLRVAKGLSQTELAESIGVRQPIVSRIEKGTHVPTWRNLERIARALGTEISVVIKLPN